MTTQTEALKLALEALEDTVDHTEIGSGPNKKAIAAIKEALAKLDKIAALQQKTESHDVDCLCSDCAALDDLDEALAQPEQEPVAYCDIHHLPEPCVQCAKEHEGYNIPPQPKETEQEPVAWDGDCVLGHCGSPAGCEASNCCRADSTTPPQRTWVGLTDEEVEACFHHVDEAGIGLFDFAEAIEDKLKEKNA